MKGIGNEKTQVTDITIIDSAYQNIEIAKRKANLDLVPKEYFSATVHRQENVDNLKRLGKIIKGLEQFHMSSRFPWFFLSHWWV